MLMVITTTTTTTRTYWLSMVLILATELLDTPVLPQHVTRSVHLLVIHLDAESLLLVDAKEEEQNLPVILPVLSNKSVAWSLGYYLHLCY